MPSKTRRNTFGGSFRDPFQSTISHYAEYLQRAGLSECSIAGYQGSARHFLIWLDGAGTKVGAVDGGVVRRFLNHDCTCRLPHPMSNHARSLQSGRCMAPISWFVRFLEETGRTPVPGELDDNLHLLDAFMEYLAEEGYSPFTLADFRFGCRHFIAWLHHHRVPIRHVDASVLDRFLRHDCICFLPGVFRGRSDFTGTRKSDAELKKFVKFLSSRGLIPETVSSGQTPDDGLEAFRSWLRQHRGINDRSIRGHARNVAQLLTELGDDPARYDAAVIRDVLLRRLERVSRGCVKRMTTSLRMYLRFPRFERQLCVRDGWRRPHGPRVESVCAAPLHSPGRMSSVASLRAIGQRTRDCVTERSCSFSPGLPCARAMFSTCGLLTSTGITHGCACAARRGARWRCRFLRMSATRFSITSQGRVRASTRSGCFSGSTHRTGPCPTRAGSQLSYATPLTAPVL